MDFDILRSLRSIFFANGAQDASFTVGAGDVGFLALLRFLIVPALVTWRTRRAAREKQLAQISATETVAKSASSKTQHKERIAMVDDDIDFDDKKSERQPLLVESPSLNAASGAGGDPLSRQSLLSTVRQQIDFDRVIARHTQSMHGLNRILLVIIFIFLTTCLIFTGVKVVLFQFATNHPLFVFQATAMSLGVVFMTIELWLSRDIIDEASKDEGRLIPSVHLHGLQLDDTLAGHWCDQCETRISDRTAYTCRFCNFDLCLECFKKASKKQTEEQIRGDKGERVETELTNWMYVKRAFVFVKPFWTWVAMAIAIIMARSISSVLLPSYQGAILDRVIARDHEGFWHQITLYSSFTVSVMLLSSLQSLCFSVAGRKMGALVKNELYRAILVQDIAFFDGVSSGQLTSRLSGDVWAMMSPVQYALGTTVGSSLQLVGALIMCINTSFRLSVLAFTTIGPIVLLYKVYSQWSRKINHRIWAAWGDSSAKATQALKAIRTVRAFSMEPKEIEGFEKATGEGLAMGMKDAYAGMLTSLMSNMIDMGVTVLLLIYGGLEVMRGDASGLTIGSLITFQLYWDQINSSYQSLTSVFTQFTQAGGAAQRVISLLDSLPDIDVNAGEKIARADFRGELELRDVRFTYQMRPETEVLKGINLKVEAGKTLALVGPSGGGKSTLIHMLMRFYDPSQGTVLIDNHDLRDLCALDIRRHMGVVSQETQLFNGTIAENIGYGAEVYTQEDLEAAAKAANAAEFIAEMDEGYETKVGENGVRLSGGQRQRIALARMLLRKPQVLLLDEATSALDSESETLVQAAIDRMLSERRCTVVLVAHRLSTVVNADLIAVIDKGTVAERGTHDELLAKNGIYAKLVAKQIVKDSNKLADI